MPTEPYRNHRQWIQQILAHQEAPVPYNLPLSHVSREKLEHYYNTSDVEEYLDLPIRMNGLQTIKPLYAHPNEYGLAIRDEFGVVWSTSEIDRGSPIGPCLAEPSLEHYRFPDPAQFYRFEHLEEWCARNREHFTILWVGDLWERAVFMRGMEEILLDVSLNPLFVRQLLRGIADYILETLQILVERYPFDGIAVSDDYGTQRSMVMSPSTWRELIKPLLSEIYTLAKANNRIVFHHSCGHVRPIVPDLIDIGLDILHPIQPETMDIFELKREFGSHLSFCGGLNTQDLLPYGTPDQVRAEVRHLKEIMGKDGGYILEPGITLQADVPVENMVAMIEEARV